MPTIGSILSNASTALRAQQAALSVTSHNITNSATEGYAQQRAVLSSNPALCTPEGVFGTGIRVADVQQVRDALLDSAFRLETASASQQRTRADLLGRVETLLGEPSEEALSGVLDRFLSAWSDLASNPTGGGARTVVRQRGQELADTMNSLASGLDAIREEVETRLTLTVARVNALTDDIAGLNREIVAIESSGVTAADLRDARARSLDELAALVPVRAHERENGSVGVALSGYNIVDGASSMHLDAAAVGGEVGVRVQGRASLLSDLGGSLGGLLQVLNADVPTVLDGLDRLAGALVAEVNAIHASGTNPAGDTGLDFLDPAGVTAFTLALSAEVAASADAVAAGTGDALGGYRAGANDVALELAGLRDRELGALGSLPGEHLQGLVSALGLAVRSSSDAAEVHETLAGHADTRRQSVSSVSVDEEMVRLIQFQSAYRAAARVVSAADEMLQTLLAL